jgi:hypothetical protein
MQQAAADPSFLSQTLLMEGVQWSADEPADRKKTLLNELVASRFALCGGSARLLFFTSELDAATFLEQALGELNADEKRQLFLKEMSPAHSRVKNLLVQRYVLDPAVELQLRYRLNNMGPICSSRFVLQRLYSALDLSTMRSLYAISERINPSMWGWAFEALVLKFLSTNETTAFIRATEPRAEKATEVVWKVDCCACFSRSNRSKVEVKGLQLFSENGFPLSLGTQDTVLRREMLAVSQSSRHDCCQTRLQ